IRCDLPAWFMTMLQEQSLECETFQDTGITILQEFNLLDMGQQLNQLLARSGNITSCMLLYLVDDVTVGHTVALAMAGAINSILTPRIRRPRVPIQESWLIHQRLLWHLQCEATTDCEVQGHVVGDPETT